MVCLNAYFVINMVKNVSKIVPIEVTLQSLAKSIGQISAKIDTIFIDFNKLSNRITRLEEETRTQKKEVEILRMRNHDLSNVVQKLSIQVDLSNEKN